MALIACANVAIGWPHVHGYVQPAVAEAQPDTVPWSVRKWLVGDFRTGPYCGYLLPRSFVTGCWGHVDADAEWLIRREGKVLVATRAVWEED